MTFQAGAISSNLILNLTQWNKSIQKVNTQTQNLNKGIQKNKQNFQQAGRAMTVAGAAITAAFGLMTKSAITMNAEMAKISTLLTDKTTKSVVVLKDSVRELAIRVGKDTSDLAGGMFEVISAFGETAASSKKLEINAIAAAAGMSTTKDSIKLTSAVTKGFNDTSDAAVRKVTDLAFMTNKLGQTTFPELAASIGSTVPMFVTLKGTQEELFATFATLTGVTGNTSEVATQFSGILGSLIKQTPEMTQAIRGLGFETSAAMIKELGLVKSLDALVKSTDGTAESVGKLFRRKEALTAVLALTGAQAEVFTEKFDIMKDSTGAADEAFEKMTGGINKAGFEMSQAKIKIQVMSQQIGEKLLPIVSSLITAVGNAASKISEWAEKYPTLTKVIMIATASLGALLAIVGPLLIILPQLSAGIAMVSAAITTKFIPALIKMAPAMWAVLAPFLKIAAAFAAGWAIGRFIGGILGLDGPLQSLIGSFQKTQEEWDKLIKMKMGFTKQAEDLLNIRQGLLDAAEAAGIIGTRLSKIVPALFANKEAFEALDPKLKEYIQTHGWVQRAVEATAETERGAAIVRREISDELLTLLTDMNLKTKELVLEETDFKLFQLEEEHQARIADLQAAGAIKIEFQKAEKLHQLQVKKIRDEARKKEEKATAEHLEKIRVQEIKEFEEAQAREEEVHNFILNLMAQKEMLELDTMRRRGELRAAELIEVRSWEQDQLDSLTDRLSQGLIEIEDFEKAKALIEGIAREKRKKANEDEGKRDQDRRDKNSKAIVKFATAWNEKIQQTIGFLSKLNDAFTDKKISNLESWYAREQQRINDNVMDESERESQLEALGVKFAQKKAQIEDASAKREKKLAIASAISNTAVAITKAATTAPWPFNIPAIAFAIAMGAAQLAIIGSSYSGPGVGDFGPGGSDTGDSVGGPGGNGAGEGGPPGGSGTGIPRFARGGSISRDLDFITGEEGPEFVRKRGGRITITPLPNFGDIGRGGERTVILEINLSTVDSTGIEELFDNKIVPAIRRALDNNTLTVPQTALEAS